MQRLPTGWLLVSIALHLPVLAALTHTRMTTVPASVIEVTLLEPTAASQGGLRIEKTPPATPLRAAGETPPLVRTRLSQAAKPVPVVLRESPANNPPAPLSAQYPQQAAHDDTQRDDTNRTASRARAEQHLTLRLLDIFARYFDYPQLARRRGWEGLVKVHLRIEPDGQLSHIELAASSGYPTLDEAALASARRIGPLYDAAHWLDGQSFDLIVPVRYGLTDT